MSIFKPSRNADFLRSRTLFFVVVLVLHFVWSIVAALDISSRDTRHSASHVAIAAYNLGIQVVSFGIIGSFAYVDSKTLERSSWYNHVFFEIILYSVLAVLQLAGSLAYSALAHRFDCSGSANSNSSCSTAIRAILVGNWTISLLYVVFTLWFTTSAILAARRDPTVWRSRSRTFDWEAERHPSLITPSSPLDIIGVEKRQTTPLSKPRKTWVLPLSRQGPRPRVESTPHLPIQNLPPPTPFTPWEPIPPIPEHHLALARQSIPEDISLNETPDDVFRPIPLPQAAASKERNKIMSIKPLKLHRPRGSLDKESIGRPKAFTAGRSTLGESKFMSLTAVESQFQHWWEPESSFARQTPRFASFNGAPTVSSKSRYSTLTGTTVPPTPPPKDQYQIPLSATTAVATTATTATTTITSPASSNPFREYPDRRAMSTSPVPRVTSPVSRVTSPVSRVTSPSPVPRITSPVPPRVTSPVPRGYI